PTDTTTEETSEPVEKTGVVDGDELVGMNWEAAQQALKDEGFTNVIGAEGDSADADQVGLVYNVDPTGARVPLDREITLTYYTPFGDVAKPATPTTSSATIDSGSQANISWAVANCPTGLQVKAYNLSIKGDVNNPPGSTQGTNVTITAKQL